MVRNPTAVNKSVVDRWDQLYEALAAEHRRMILYSLMDIPKERQLPLPEAARSSNLSIDPDELRIQLQHHHLPKLAEFGYVRWEQDPFCVQRGHAYEEVEAVFSVIVESLDQYPMSLINGCERFEEMYGGRQQ